MNDLKGKKRAAINQERWKRVRKRARKEGKKEEIEGEHTFKRLKCIILVIPVCGFYLDPKKEYELRNNNGGRGGELPWLRICLAMQRTQV